MSVKKILPYLLSEMVCDINWNYVYGTMDTMYKQKKAVLLKKLNMEGDKPG